MASRTSDISSACHWAVNAAAATEHGRVYGHAYSLAPAGIFVAPDSGLRTPEEPELYKHFYAPELYDRTQRWMHTWNLFDASLWAQSGFEQAVVV